MGFSTIYPTGGSSTPTRSGVVTPRAAPIGSTSQAPEPFGVSTPFGRYRLDADAAANAVQIGASAPGYVMERPIAALDTLSGGAVKSGIDQAGDFIRNIPIAGPALSGLAQGVGNTYEGLNRLTRAPINAGMAKALRETANLAPTAHVDPITAWLAGNSHAIADRIDIGGVGQRAVTVGELRDIAKRRGFTEQDIADLVAGRKDIWDFADRQLSDNPIVNVAGTIAADPTNLLLLGGAGALARGAAKGLDAFTRGTSTLGHVDRIISGSNAIRDAVKLSGGYKSSLAGMQALARGEVYGVTVGTLGRYIAAGSRGVGDGLAKYRKLAYLTTGAQLAGQSLENSPISHLTEPIWKAANALAENKPLSESALFNLWSAINFPVRQDAAKMWGDLRSPVAARDVQGRATAYKTGISGALARKTAADISDRIVTELAPQMFSRDLLGRKYGTEMAAARARVFERFGGEDRFNAHVEYSVQQYIMQRLPEFRATNRVQSSLEFAALGTKLADEAALHTRWALEEGTIPVHDFMEWWKENIVGPRSYDKGRPVTGRVHREYDPDVAIDTWLNWVGKMDSLKVAGKWDDGANLVTVGVADALMPREWLNVLDRLLKAAEDPVRKVIPRRRMQEILDIFPGIEADINDPTNFFARLKGQDAIEVSYAQAKQRVTAMKRGSRNRDGEATRQPAPTLREILWEEGRLEAREQSLAQKRGRVTDENGNFDARRAPVWGEAAIIGQSTTSTIRRAMGADSYADALATRSADDVMLREGTLEPAMLDLGAEVSSVTQGITSSRGRTATSVAVTVPSTVSHVDLLLYAAIMVKHGRMPSAKVVISGAEALARNRLTPNAVHVRFDIGNIPEAAMTDSIIEAVKDAFDGQFDMNDTAGVLDVMVRPGQEAAIQSLSDDVMRIMGREARQTTAPAWFETVIKGEANGRTAGVSARSILADNATDIRVVNARQSFRTAASERRGLVGTSDGSFARGPGHARPGGDDLGRDGRGVVPSTESTPGTATSPADPAGVSGQVPAGNAAPDIARAKARIIGRSRMGDSGAPDWTTTRDMLEASGRASGAPDSIVQHEPGKYVAYGPDGQAVGYLSFETNAMRGLEGVRSVVVSAERQGIATRLYDVAYAEHGTAFLGAIGKTSMTDAGAAFAYRWLEKQAAPAPSLTDIVRQAEGTQGRVLHLAEADDLLSNMTPRMGPDLAGLPDAEWQKVKNIERELRTFDPTYRLKVAPHVKDATAPRVATYHSGQGGAIKQLVAASRAASDLAYHKQWKRAADFMDLMIGHRYTRRMSGEAKQLLYAAIFARTQHLETSLRPRIKDIDSFLETIGKRAERNITIGDSRTGRVDLLPPGAIREVFDGRWGRAFSQGNEGYFQGFSREAQAAIGDPSALLDLTGSRFYRNLRETAKADGKRGEMARALKGTYSLTRVKSVTPRLYIRSFYHLVRFTFNPWWHVQNRLEADILGLAKYGTSRWRREADQGWRLWKRDRSAMGDVKKGDFEADLLASGYMPARNQEAAAMAAFKTGRLKETRQYLMEFAANDPAASNVLSHFGGTVDEWADGLERLMYDIDNKGIEVAILDDAVAALGDQVAVEAMMPLITRLYERHRVIRDDVLNTFYGNTNRSNLERIFNSYFLFWPLSYQLKTAKWMFDVLTKGAFGTGSNFVGVWTLDRLYDQHVQMLAEDEGYQRMFLDNPGFWQSAAMLLPVVPYDSPGVSLSRATRYALAAGGIVKDEGFEKDPLMSAISLGAIGPIYSIEIAKRIVRESRDKPKRLPAAPAA